jgi:hypothetical protein
LDHTTDEGPRTKTKGLALDRSEKGSRSGVPGWPSALRVAPRDGIQRSGSVPRLSELIERLAAHGGVDVQVRGANDGPELLEHEEADTVVDYAAPVQRANQVAFLERETGFIEE